MTKSTNQLTFNETKIRKHKLGYKCEKEISEMGFSRQCSNTAYLEIKNKSELKRFCFQHSRNDWVDVIKKRELNE